MRKNIPKPKKVGDPMKIEEGPYIIQETYFDRYSGTERHMLVQYFENVRDEWVFGYNGDNLNNRMSSGGYSLKTASIIYGLIREKEKPQYKIIDTRTEEEVLPLRDEETNDDVQLSMI